MTRHTTGFSSYSTSFDGRVAVILADWFNLAVACPDRHILGVSSICSHSPWGFCPDCLMWPLHCTDSPSLPERFNLTSSFTALARSWLCILVATPKALLPSKRVTQFGVWLWEGFAGRILRWWWHWMFSYLQSCVVRRSLMQTREQIEWNNV